jgi:hypothetical protein
VNLHGSGIAGRDLWGRASKIEDFHLPEMPASPAWFNEAPEAAQMLATESAAKSIQRQRGVNSELIAALDDLYRYTSAVDDQLAGLSGVGENWTPLLIGAGLAAVGALLGGAASLVALAA